MADNLINKVNSINENVKYTSKTNRTNNINENDNQIKLNKLESISNNFKVFVNLLKNTDLNKEKLKHFNENLINQLIPYKLSLDKECLFIKKKLENSKLLNNCLDNSSKVKDLLQKIDRKEVIIYTDKVLQAINIEENQNLFTKSIDPWLCNNIKLENNFCFFFIGERKEMLKFLFGGNNYFTHDSFFYNSLNSIYSLLDKRFDIIIIDYFRLKNDKYVVDYVRLLLIYIIIK